MKLGITFYVKEVYLNNITIRIPESSRLRDRDRKENTKIRGKVQGNKQEAEICFENVECTVVFIFFC